MKRYLAILLALVTITASLSGCSSDTPSNNNSTESSTDSKIVKWGLGVDIEVLDPALCNYSTSNMVLRNVFGGLFRVDENNVPEKVYCEDYTVDETGTKYEFTLVEGAKWSDGSPLTAYDFEYGIKRAADPELASKAAADSFFLKNAEAAFNGEASLDDIGVKAVDDRTLTMELSGPYSYFLYMLASPTYFPAKKDIVESDEDWTKKPETYISNGQFMAKEIGQLKYTFVKNPNYIFADKSDIEELRIIIMQDKEAAMVAYKNGDIDVTDAVTPEAIKEYKDTELNLADRVQLIYFDLNTYNEEMSDPRVRQALSMAIDRDAIITKVLERDHHPAFGVVPYGMPDLEDSSKQFRDTAGDLFSEDVEKAKQLLADAGYPDGEGMPVLKFYVSTDRTDVAQAMQSMWQENLNIKSEITAFEPKAYWGEQEAMEFDVFYDGYTASFPDPYGMFFTFIWQKQERQTGWKSEEFEALLNDSNSTIDNARRSANFKRAEEIMMDDMPIIPLFFTVDSFVCKPNVNGVYKTYGGHILFGNATVN